MYQHIFITLIIISSLLNITLSQQAGTLTPEVHPPLTWQECSEHGCTARNGKIVIDANWRWVHSESGTNCYTGNSWDTTICPDGRTCARNCYLEGAEYEKVYGVTTDRDSVRLNFITQSQGRNIGSRLFLMEDESNYQMFHVLGKEFRFDVDVSKLDCGLNGALYFVSMDKDGGMSRFPSNSAGARYGTGYCDAQCPRDIKFISGSANVEGWTPSSVSGNHGSCCAEMDLWEANNMATACTPHPCKINSQTSCINDECGGPSNRYGSICDPDGCDFNPYRQGNTNFYGPDLTVNTKSKITVVTQFITDDGTSSGTLISIKRIYVQNGKIISQSESLIEGARGNQITEEYCNGQKVAFGEENSFNLRGGMAQMGEALKEGMVLVLSIWHDYNAHMLWLDSSYPTNSPANRPGVARGPCATTSGIPTEVEANNPDAFVVFSNIKVGPIGSTF